MNMQNVFKPLLPSVNPTIEFMLGLASRTNCALSEVTVGIAGQPGKQMTPLVVKTREKLERTPTEVISDIAEFLKLMEGCCNGVVRFAAGNMAIMDYYLINGGHVRAAFTIEEPTMILFQV